MRDHHAWTFAMVILIAFFLYAWNHYAPFFPILGETAEVEAILVNHGWKHGPMGHGAVQVGVFAFRVEQELHLLRQVMDARRGYIGTGSRLIIQYEVADPTNIRILRYTNVMGRCHPNGFYTVSNDRWLSVDLCNDILSMRTKTMHQNVLDSAFLVATMHGDTLLAYPIGQESQSEPERFLIQEGRRTTLTDLRSGVIYSK